MAVYVAFMLNFEAPAERVEMLSQAITYLTVKSNK